MNTTKVNPGIFDALSRRFLIAMDEIKEKNISFEDIEKLDVKMMISDYHFMLSQVENQNIFEDYTKTFISKFTEWEKYIENESFKLDEEKYIPKKERESLRDDINSLAEYIKMKEFKNQQLISNLEEKIDIFLFYGSEIADLFMDNNNYKRAYTLYKTVLNEDVKKFIKNNNDVTEKDFTAFIITSVKLYLCALELTADKLKETETFIKRCLFLVFKINFVNEEYERVLNENLKAYEELQDVKKLEIYKILFLSQDEDKNFVDHTEQNFTKNKQGDDK